MDHNFISAYFIISEDAKHGENLVCSYYACRNGGIKFRYCAYCMAPVAKRNFSRRHDHGMLQKKLKGGSSETAGKATAARDSTAGKSAATKTGNGPAVLLETAPEEDEVKKKRKRDNENTNNEEDDDAAVGKQKEEAGITGTVAIEAEETSTTATIMSSKRESVWNNLLTQRPRTKNPNQLSSWLNEVLAVSDTDFPLDQVGSDLNHSFGSTLLENLQSKAKKKKKKKSETAADGDKYAEVAAAAAEEDSSTATAKSKHNDPSSTTDIVIGGDGSERSSQTKKMTTAAPPSSDASSEDDDDDDDSDSDGFSGSFAVWRDRKKGKPSLKKLKRKL